MEQSAQAAPCSLRKDDGHTCSIIPLRRKVSTYLVIGALAVAGCFITECGKNTNSLSESLGSKLTNTRIELLLKQDITNIEVQTTALRQDCEVAGYMVNGRTDNGWWYQNVLSYRSNKFELESEEWTGGLTNTRLQTIRGFTINEGDKIILGLKIKSGKIVMAATNLDNPEVSCTISYSNPNATKFITSRDDPNTTSIMVEDWSKPGKEIKEADFLIIQPSSIGLASMRYQLGLPTDGTMVGKDGGNLDQIRTDWAPAKGPVFSASYSASENECHMGTKKAPKWQQSTPSK